MQGFKPFHDCLLVTNQNNFCSQAVFYEAKTTKRSSLIFHNDFHFHNHIYLLKHQPRPFFWFEFSVKNKIFLFEQKRINANS